MAPRLAAHQNAIYLNGALFARVDSLHARRDHLALAPEARRLLERVHLDFVLAGARLDERAKLRFAAVSERLAELQTTFSQNVLHDESTWVLWLTDERDLAGLPAFVRAAAREAARTAGTVRRLGDHTEPIAGRAVPDVLRSARPARAGVQGLDAARRACGRTRQPPGRA